jgi:hypothetical protein
MALRLKKVPHDRLGSEVGDEDTERAWYVEDERGMPLGTLEWSGPCTGYWFQPHRDGDARLFDTLTMARRGLNHSFALSPTA